MKYSTCFGILFTFMIISGLIAGQNAMAFSEEPTKENKQVLSGIFLIGFVGMYGGVIYMHKSSEMKKTVFNQRKQFN